MASSRSGRLLAAAWRQVQAAAMSPSASSAGISGGRPAQAAHLLHRAAASPAGLLGSSPANSCGLLPALAAHSLQCSSSSFSGLPALGALPFSPLQSSARSLFTSCPVSAAAASGPGGVDGSGGAGGVPSGEGSSSDDGSGDEELPSHLKRRSGSHPDPASAASDDADLKRQARMVMGDPMSMLMASRGMPLGISMDDTAPPIKTKAPKGPKPEPGYQMEALDDIFAAAKEGDDFQAVANDQWGTTRQGADEIAKRLADSNRDLAAMAAEADAELAARGQMEDEGLKLVLAPGEAKYRTLEEMSRDIKELDEVFELLASVPWLDETNLQEKELKGVAMYGLLGTLEEVGFKIRDQVHRIWAGEDDQSMMTDCEEAKDQAALISILFHTKKLIEEYGPPPAPVKVA